MSPIALLVMYCGLILAASLIGGWVPLLIRLTHERMELAVSFVSGVLPGGALLHLLPHAWMQRAAWMKAGTREAVLRAHPRGKLPGRRNRGGARGGGCEQLGFRRAHRRGVDDDVRGSDVRRIVTERHGDSERAQALDGRALAKIGPADLVTLDRKSVV